MYHFKSTLLNHVILYKEVSSLDMLGFLVVFRIIQQIDCALIVVIERRDKRVNIVSFS